MTINTIYESRAQKLEERVLYREKALIYAEYLHYSARLIENKTTFKLCESGWRIFVRVIELHLMVEESLELRQMRIRDFEPKWIFFARPITRFTTLDEN